MAQRKLITSRNSGLLALLLGTLLTMLLAACGGGSADTNGYQQQNTGSSSNKTGSTSSGASNQMNASGATLQVKIMEKKGATGDEYWFEPASLSILPGTTIEWVNESDEEHMLTSQNAALFNADSEVKENGSYKKTFMESGNFSYGSKEYPTMAGSIQVQNSNAIEIMIEEKKTSQGDAYWLTPAGLVISAGTTVTWNNMTDEEHMLVSKDSDMFTPESEVKENGKLNMTFSNAGTYTYYSKKLPDTKGIIVVVPAA